MTARIYGTTAARFWPKVDRSGGSSSCWEWRACLNRRGYGQIKIVGVSTLAHRVSFCLNGGILSERRPFVLHRCDNSKCVNPLHLYAGTWADNAADMVIRKRQATGTRHGLSRFDEADVTEIRTAVEAGELMGQVAARFGVCRHTVSRIVNRKSYPQIDLTDVSDHE